MLLEGDWELLEGDMVLSQVGLNIAQIVFQQTYDTRMQGALGKYETGYAAAEKIRQD